MDIASPRVFKAGDEINWLIPWLTSGTEKRMWSMEAYESEWKRMYLYLYSAQYLHVRQDSKRNVPHLTVQVQSNSQITDIPRIERQRYKDDHLSRTLRFFNLPLGIGPNDRGPPF